MSLHIYIVPLKYLSKALCVSLVPGTRRFRQISTQWSSSHRASDLLRWCQLAPVDWHYTRRLRFQTTSVTIAGFGRYSVELFKSSQCRALAESCPCWPSTL